ncbi:hypothetical protein TRFO_41890 [Tritrichomonas foetus]|uniref:Protein kinase domain-containing protein n=1 Tax=Tritrichomonas foetus TaxID=1144522 RepID=A0A1J4L2Z4_9EUKA|nr:hypothetical protein TRFO_41890 [Tritrichomonas foetus]|eukprot:OHT16318.1 hypothetical protein TRFO_41890 [Tritrichomonas foetus]
MSFAGISRCTVYDDLFTKLVSLPQEDKNESKLDHMKNNFFSSIYFNSEGQVVQKIRVFDYQEYEEDESDESFAHLKRKSIERQKVFFDAVFEQYICSHPCVVPLLGWSLYNSSMDDSLAIITDYYETNLYEYMKTWVDKKNFDPTNAAVILYGICRGCDYIIKNGYSIHNNMNSSIVSLTPKNIFLKKSEFANTQIYIPFIADLGFLPHVNVQDSSFLIPDELKETDDPRIIQFIVGLYYLFIFSPSSQNHIRKKKIPDQNHLKSKVKKFFGFTSDINFEIEENFMNNYHVFRNQKKFFTFDGQADVSVFDSYVTFINNSLKQQPVNDPKENNYDHFWKSYEDNLNFSEINSLLDKQKESQDQLAIMYGSGLIGSPNFCNAAYYAAKASDYSKYSSVSFLRKFPNCQYSEAEKLFHEAEVLEGNAYSYKNDLLNSVIKMAADKYYKSAQLGYIPARTKLAVLLLNSNDFKNSDKKIEKEDKVIDTLLKPAAETDPQAMYELGMIYKRRCDYHQAANFFIQAYENNYIDAAFQLACTLTMLEPPSEENQNYYLNQARNVFQFASKQLNDEVAEENCKEIDRFLAVKQSMINKK